MTDDSSGRVIWCAKCLDTHREGAHKIDADAENGETTEGEK